MINIRYHIVSITAVFLALGIGVALGSTFLDNSTVSLLNRNIRSAENRITETRAENQRLQAGIDGAAARDEALTQVGSGPLFDGQLTDVPVLIVAAPGVDGDAVADLRTALDGADADLRGTLELRPDLAFADGVPDGVLEALDLDADTDDARREVWDQLNQALADAGQAAPEDPEGSDEEPGGTDPGATTTTTAPAPAATTTVPDATTTTEAGDPGTTTTTEVDGAGAGDQGGADEPVLDGEQPDVVTALLAGKQLNLVPGPGLTGDDPILETTGYRFVFVSGPDLDASANDLLLQLLPEDDAPPAVVVSATVPPLGDDDEPPAPSAVARVRASAALAARYSTVDDIDTFSGLVATVLTLEQVDRAVPGQFGEGEGATAVLPPPS